MNNLQAKFKIFYLRFKKMPVHVFATGIILSAALMFVLFDFARVYSQETTIILLPKTETAAIELDKITANVAAFPRMLSFYQRMLKDNPQLPDAWAEKKDDKRQVLWSKQIETNTSRFQRGSLVIVRVTAASQNETKDLSRIAMQTLFAVTSKYYNTQTELEMKVVNGPMAKVEIRDWFLWALISTLLGFAVAFLIESFLQRTEKIFLTKKITAGGNKLKQQFGMLSNFIVKPKLPKIEKIEDIYAAHEKSLLEKQEEYVFPEIAELHRKKQENIYPNFPEMPIRKAGIVPEAKKAQAPENLPVAFSEEEIVKAEMPTASVPHNLPFAEDEAELKFETIVQEAGPAEKLQQKEERLEAVEPSAEELKQRLNQLLRGEF